MADKTFEVKQDSTTEFTVKFDQPLKSLSVADVSVIRLFSNYEYPIQVKSVALAKDGLSASVSVFASFVDKTEYIIKVKGYEDENLTASVGKPVRMDIIAVDANGNPKNPSMVIYTNEATELACIFYDAKDVRVSSTEKVRFTLDKTASTKDCYLNGNKLTIKKNTASAMVVASFPGWIENGKRVGDFTQTQLFFAEDKAEVFPASVTQFTLNNEKWWGNNVHSFQMSENPGLYVMLSQSDYQNANEVYGANDMNKVFKGDVNKKSTITFTALNPDVAVISSTGKLTGFKEGYASFYVNYKRYDVTTKKSEEIPFAIVEVQVLKNSELGDVVGTASSLKVGTHVDYDDTSLFMLGSDQYGARYNVQDVTTSSANFVIECLSEGYGDQKALAAIVRKACATETYYNDGQSKNGIKININANDLRAQLVKDKAMDATENGEFVDLEFRATYTHQGWNKKSVEFTVCIQEPSSADYSITNNDNIVEVVASDASKDVLRRNEWNQKDRKSVSYYVNIMNNDVQVGVVNVTKYNAEAVSENAYQVKVLKNGEDVTNNGNIVVSGSKITVYPSYTDKLSARAQKAVSGGAIEYVKYDGLGEGVYTLELYKWNKDGNNDWIDSLENTADISISVSDAGTYSLDVENQRKNTVKVNDAVGDAYDEDDAAKVLYCFNFINRDGGNVLKSWTDAIESNQKFTEYFVDYYAPEDSDYVYVKEVVFYEPVDGAWAAYVVPVDVSLIRE